MRLVRSSAAGVFAALVFASSAQAAPAPTNLKPFLLRVDEPAARTFARTPSFAWSPVQGARRYEFELATSKTFAEASVVWSSAGLKSPLTAVPVTLPWMTGTPYALYAHVRAITRSGVSRWSAPYGFNMRWTSVPASLPAQPGLVRWSPIEGGTSYNVWYLDAGKVFSVKTNVADQRDYYTFHQHPSWTSTVRWRVRAVRVLAGASKNRLPAVSYGPWSPVFTQYNPPLANAPFGLAALASDVTSGASATAFRLMPGFSFTGNTSLAGRQHGLYRVVVSTDRDCVNIVYRGAIVGSPAYAPRATGPLDLPKKSEDLLKAMNGFIKDGSEGDTFGDDGFKVVTNESVKGEGATAPGQDPGSGADPAPGTSLPSDQTVQTSLVDLWDSGWPSGRYYWTVVPVTVTSNREDPEKLEYHETEVPQDACAAGRVGTFGKTSEPVLTGSGAPYVSGMSPDGRLQPATRARPTFYGAPVASWLPALGADQYEVQWSKKRYPWKAAGNVVTPSTSAELPLGRGLWYYRVRGISMALPEGAKQMTWSDPVALRVAGPRFVVLR